MDIPAPTTRSRILNGSVFICFCITLAAAFQRLLIPFAIDYGEGCVLDAGVLILRQSSPYPEPGSFPYVLNPYGPVGYLLTALGIKMFGLSLIGPRLLVLFAGIGICFLIAALTKRFGGQWQIGFLFGTLYLCTPLVFEWFPLLRVDFWVVFLSLAGLYLFCAFQRAWYLAPIAFAFAILTKPTAIAAPVACGLVLLLERRFRRAAAFTAVVASVVLVCALVLGRNFAFNMLETHPDPYLVTRLLDLFFAAIGSSLLSIAVVVYSAATGFRWTRASQLAWFYLVACSFTALSAGKLGANTNYFLEWSAAVCIMAALAFSHLLRTRDSLARVFQAGFVVLIAVFALVACNTAAIGRDRSECHDAYAFVSSFGGQRVLSEDVAALILGGKRVLVSDPYALTQLGDSVNWARESLERLVDQQYFDLIIIGGDVERFLPRSGRWSPGVMKAISEKYMLHRRFKCFPNLGSAYVPKEER